MKSIDQVELAGKRVFIRADFNVPTDEAGRITDDTRIRAHLRTIDYAVGKNAKVICASHMGRPKGKRNEKYSLKPVAARLSELAGRPVKFLDDCVGPEVEGAIAAMKGGDIVLLENLRFYIGEEKNDAEFAKQLARLCDVYIDDAFAVSHRAAASNTAITGLVKVCAAGFLLKDEIEYFNKAMGNPERPLAAIIGGAKVSDKIGVLEKLIEKVDILVIGGAMAFTFLKAKGYEVGKSRCENEMADLARGIMEKATAAGVKLYLPVDTVIALEPTAAAETRVTTVEEMPKDWMGLDIGPKTVALFVEAIKDAKTIVWNGPLGMFEIEAFSKGTFSLVHAVAASGALTIVGGGDTDTAVHQAGESSRISYISTGGGAFLELLEGKTLPGVAALENCGGTP